MKIAALIITILLLTYFGLRVLGGWRHRAEVREAQERVRRAATQTQGRVAHAALDAADLPPIVRAFLKRALPDGTPLPRLVTLEQRGGFRLKPKAPFMNMRANQIFSVGAPAMAWDATMDMAPGLPVMVRDTLLDGHGRFGGRIFGLFAVAQGTGVDVDEATLIRYLSETVWLPQALLPSSWLRWEPVDERHAHAFITVNGRTCDGLFTFDDQARPIAFDAQRPRDLGGRSEQTPWHIVLEAHARFSGVEIPSRGAVSWILPDGPFEYGRFEISKAHFE